MMATACRPIDVERALDCVATSQRSACTTSQRPYYIPCAELMRLRTAASNEAERTPAGGSGCASRFEPESGKSNVCASRCRGKLARFENYRDANAAIALGTPVVARQAVCHHRPCDLIFSWSPMFGTVHGSSRGPARMVLNRFAPSTPDARNSRRPWLLEPPRASGTGR